jgi:hypothetical protein
VLASLWSSTTVIPPVSAGAAAGYRALFITLRRLVVGRTLSVRLDVNGSRLWLKPRGLALRRRWPIPAWVPAYLVQLPDLPHGLRLTGVSCGPAHCS